MMCSSSNDIETDVLYKLIDAEENEDATADLAVTWSNGLNPLKKACQPPIKSVWLPELSSYTPTLRVCARLHVGSCRRPCRPSYK